MRAILSRAMAFLLSLVAMSGCGGDQCWSPHGPAPVAVEEGIVRTATSLGDLKRRRFVIASIDGREFFGSGKMPELEFLEDGRVVGRACNRFMGRGELTGGVLKVANMATTMMVCLSQELNDLDRMVARMLEAGAETTLSGRTLTLTQGGHTLVYTEAT